MGTRQAYSDKLQHKVDVLRQKIISYHNTSEDSKVCVWNAKTPAAKSETPGHDIRYNLLAAAGVCHRFSIFCEIQWSSNSNAKMLLKKISEFRQVTHTERISDSGIDGFLSLLLRAQR